MKLKFRSIVAASIVMAASCNDRHPSEGISNLWGKDVEACPQGMEESLTDNERQTLLQWWPPHLLARNPELEAIIVRGALALCQGGFETLHPGSDADTVIRLTQTDWGFQPPMVISIAEAGPVRTVRLARLYLPSLMSAPSDVVEIPEAAIHPLRNIPPDAWDLLVAALERAEVEDAPVWVNESGADGNHYIFEIAHGQTYRVLIRWGPTEPEFENLGAHLMRWRIPGSVLPAPAEPASTRSVR